MLETVQCSKLLYSVYHTVYQYSILERANNCTHVGGVAWSCVAVVLVTKARRCCC
jgi:hypothetical protein